MCTHYAKQAHWTHCPLSDINFDSSVNSMSKYVGQEKDKVKFRQFDETQAPVKIRNDCRPLGAKTNTTQWFASPLCRRINNVNRCVICISNFMFAATRVSSEFISNIIFISGLCQFYRQIIAIERWSICSGETLNEKKISADNDGIKSIPMQVTPFLSVLLPVTVVIAHCLASQKLLFTKRNAARASIW